GLLRGTACVVLFGHRRMAGEHLRFGRRDLGAGGDDRLFGRTLGAFAALAVAAIAVARAALAAFARLALGWAALVEVRVRLQHRIGGRRQLRLGRFGHRADGAGSPGQRVGRDGLFAFAPAALPALAAVPAVARPTPLA